MKLDPAWAPYRPKKSEKELMEIIARYVAKCDLHMCTAIPAWVGHELLRRRTSEEIMDEAVQIYSGTMKSLASK